MLCYTSQKDLMNATAVIQAQIVGSCSDFGKTNDCLCYASRPRRNQLDWLCQEILLGFHRCLEHQCDLRVGHLCSGKRGRLPRVVVDGSYLDHVRSNDSNTLKTVEDSQEFPSGPASNFCSPCGWMAMSAFITLGSVSKAPDYLGIRSKIGGLRRKTKAPWLDNHYANETHKQNVPTLTERCILTYFRIADRTHQRLASGWTVLGRVSSGLSSSVPDAIDVNVPQPRNKFDGAYLEQMRDRTHHQCQAGQYL